MHRHIMSLAVLIGFLAVEPAGAQTGAVLHPCTFLTATEITAAVGSVGASQEGDMPGPAHRRACSWGIPGGILTLSVGKVPNANQSTRALLDYVNSMYDLLKGQGWKYDKKDLGSTSCSMLTPPAGASGSPATSCATVVKGVLVMVSASTRVSIPAEKLEPLARAAASRLP